MARRWVEPVYQALLEQKQKTGAGQFVFCTREETRRDGSVFDNLIKANLKA